MGDTLPYPQTCTLILTLGTSCPTARSSPSEPSVSGVLVCVQMFWVWVRPQNADFEHHTKITWRHGYVSRSSTPTKTYTTQPQEHFFVSFYHFHDLFFMYARATVELFCWGVWCFSGIVCCVQLYFHIGCCVWIFQIEHDIHLNAVMLLRFMFLLIVGSFRRPVIFGVYIYFLFVFIFVAPVR